MYFPTYRPRRLRRFENFRRLIRETKISVDDLIYPLFVVHGKGIKREILSMPGNFHWSIDRLKDEVREIEELGTPGIILFGIPKKKDEVASEAYAEDGIIQQSVRAIKEVTSDLLVITDVCLCEYTSHGHCGMVKDGEIVNDLTLELLAKTALSHVEAGADMVAPSDMMDGRVSAIRNTLDENGYENVPIMSYAAKYASSFYGPFREAVESAPQFGDRRSYQMDPPNALEALREVMLDIEEGADIVMVKPALAYLDIIYRVKQEFNYPVAAYNVSGEYSMVKAAAMKGWVDEKRIVMEILTGIKRAGADIILTYHAKDVARWLK
ncbi:MAG: porphobilinogen synthase [Actinomycetota bacterium]|nr:porphobilinogen synthase [Actinomycetota bacterium]MDI6821279.1 porphobilinogen synthase [Actinomycetota bacterium]